MCLVPASRAPTSWGFLAQPLKTIHMKPKFCVMLTEPPVTQEIELDCEEL